MPAKALVPTLIDQNENTFTANAAAVAAGTIALAALAQISVPVPFSPVPITGQTFGVALASLLLGRKLAPIVVSTYLSVGALGFPVFAAGRAGLSWGPTVGYLAGMLIASYLVGALADAGWSRSFLRAYLAATLGSAVIFLFGLLVLSFFLPWGQVLAAGLIPFLPGDCIKNTLAAALASGIFRAGRRKMPGEIK